MNLRKLKEKNEDLEKEKLVIKNEFTAERRTLESKLYELESDKNQAIRNHKLLEERLKF